MPTTFKITGNVTRASKLQTIRNTSYLQLIIAEKVKDKDKERTEFTTVNLWGAKAEAADRNLRKGSVVTVLDKVNRVLRQHEWKSYWNVNWIKYLSNFGGPREEQLELPLSA